MKNARPLVAIMIFATVLFSGCSKNSERIPVDGVKMNQTGLILVVGQKQQLTANVFPNDATDRLITWSSNNMAVVTVDPKSGWVSGVSPGQAIITVTTRSEGMTDNCQVSVMPEGSGVPEAITDPAFRAYVLYRMNATQEGIDENGNSKIYPKWDIDGDGKLSEEEAAAVTYIGVWNGYGGVKISSFSGIEYFTGLKVLDCSFNQLSTLDLSMAPLLAGLYCGDNDLTELDLSANPALSRMDCSSNRLTELDLSANTMLTELGFSNNQLTELDLSTNTALTRLFCSDNELTVLNLSANTGLTGLDCSNNQLKRLNLSTITELTALICSENELAALDLSANTALTTLQCQKNQLTELDLSANTELTALWCDSNQLAELDLSANTALTTLQCQKNQLTELDLSANTELTALWCDNNQLAELDLSANTRLTTLWCNNNKLSVLDASKMAFTSGTTSMYILCCGNQSIVGSTDLQTLILTLRTDQKPYWNSSLKNIEFNKGVNLAN